MQDDRPKYLRGIVIDVYPFEATDDDIIRAEAALGLVPSSLEGVKIEREQSNARMEMTRPMADALATLSVWASEAVTQYILDQVSDPGMDKDRIRNVLVPQNAQVIGIGVQSIIAQLLETGVLEYKKRQA